MTDVLSILAAGCPVVVKAHASHLATSQLCFELLEQAAAESGAPTGTVAIVHGLQAGVDLVAHPAIEAVGFTGSLDGGKALPQRSSANDSLEVSSSNGLVGVDCHARLSKG